MQRLKSFFGKQPDHYERMVSNGSIILKLPMISETDDRKRMKKIDDCIKEYKALFSELDHPNVSSAWDKGLAIRANFVVSGKCVTFSEISLDTWRSIKADRKPNLAITFAEDFSDEALNLILSKFGGKREWDPCGSEDVNGNHVCYYTRK